MKKKNLLFQSLLYLILGALFVYFAVNQVNDRGWGYLAYIIIAMAVFDFVAGLRLLFIAFAKRKN
ncbi:YdiK family protein [Listeria sp. PSOL-1]|uniref:YdiK family protein n=1 Tax=Listeria sp. PSOL-1 TaxID=1844999 RepID=UPI0013D0F5D9|nr:YdiK family protein [Listeria sp. PSOL-1]